VKTAPRRRFFRAVFVPPAQPPAGIAQPIRARDGVVLDATHPSFWKHFFSIKGRLQLISQSNGWLNPSFTFSCRIPTFINAKR
jgi:hypothetical protein